MVERTMVGDRVPGVLRGLLALLVTLGSSLVGLAYVVYLRATPFPPDSARIVPFVWLLSALLGLALALWALRRGPLQRRSALALGVGIIGVLLALPNVVSAALYALGALMGD